MASFFDAPRIQSPKPPNTNVKFVWDLIDIDVGTWKASIINQLFRPSDARSILSIPLVNMMQLDEILWHYEKNGNYTVKSAYRVYMDRLAGRNELKLEGDWSSIWSLNVPPKVKTCIWRACRDSLPLRLAIHSRGVCCTPLCVVYNNGKKSCWQLFLTCPTSVTCWRKSHLWNAIEGIMLIATNFRDFFFQAREKFDDNSITTFSMLIWSIWKMRNQRLWDNVTEQPDQIMHRAEHVLLAWRCAHGQQSRAPTTPTTEEIRWSPPPPGWLKCNVDDAVNAGSNCVSIGCYLRDEKGAFVQARTSWLPVVMTPAEAETWGLLQAIHWIEELNLHVVIFELDCQQVVLDMLKDKYTRNEYGCLIVDCKSRLALHNDFKVVFVKRQANSSVHALVKTATSYAPRTTLLSMPYCIQSIIMNELS